jgi:glycerol uptake facilitator-like aquaporin
MLRQMVGDPLVQRALMGLAMRGTAIALIYSPLGARSGAHLNPATTLAFWRLGKLHGAAAAAYVLAQVVGACAGMLAAAFALHGYLAAPEHWPQGTGRSADGRGARGLGGTRRENKPLQTPCSAAPDPHWPGGAFVGREGDAVGTSQFIGDERQSPSRSM